MRARFGKKMYRLSLAYPFTCPNRDGTKGVGGCIFCSGAGAGNFAADSGSADEKISAAKERISRKTAGGCGYIAYFQSFTNTYAPVPYLEKIFTEVIARPDIDAISVATRPDCIGEDTARLFEKLGKIKPVWVELGLQTSNERTAEFINRQYPLADYNRAVKLLHSCGAEVITHIILGLPGENIADMENTVIHAVNMKTDGVKLHLLHVLKDTVLERLYRSGEYAPLTLEEYADILCRLLPLIPAETVIHRMTGDGDKKELIAPLWSADKKRVLNYINAEFKARDIVQGSAVKKQQ